MSRNSNLHSEESPELFDKNLSRLVKLAKETDEPDKAFTDSLIINTISELKRLEAEGKYNRKRTIKITGWLEKTVGWAAMFIAAVGAGMVSVASVLLQLHTILAATTSVTVLINWLNYFRGLKL